jgi:hypothetical protein
MENALLGMAIIMGHSSSIASFGTAPDRIGQFMAQGWPAVAGVAVLGVAAFKAVVQCLR